jgi:GNAT superfamily N-acetyltransferase
MNNDTDSPADLTFRTGTPADWPMVASIIAQTRSWGDYVNQPVWQDWTSNPGPSSQPVIVDQGGYAIAFARLSELGPAEWWLEGLRVAPDKHGQGIRQALLAHMIGLFKTHGLGLLRLLTSHDDERGHTLAKQAGFRHAGSYAIMRTGAEPADYRNFRILQPQNLEMAHRYLQRSPMHHVNPFAEHNWVLYFLTKDRLQAYLADEQVQVIGWRHADQLRGLAILYPTLPEPDGGNLLQLGYLDAADDTTLRAMVAALRGLAAKHGHEGVAWKMPLGVGLERPIAQCGMDRVWDGALWLFEMPLRA